MEIPKLKYPTETITLPVSNRDVTIRPFLVKEQKIVLMSAESAISTGNIQEIYKAIGMVTNNCVLDTDFDVRKTPFVELEYLFLKIRSISVSSEIDLQLPCENEDCKKMNDVKVNLDDIKILLSDDYDPIIKLPKTEDDKEWGIKMKLPTYQMMLDIDMENMNDIGHEIIAECMDQLFNEDETVNPVKEWGREKVIENLIENFDSSTFEAIENFFVNMPKINHTVEFECHDCQTKNKLVLDSISDFF